uniref:Uncharacterized protein n=1 Tax=Lepeophtheirus salmonis TaxID=72036 RepID=A0A0K2T3F3_LEPSM
MLFLPLWKVHTLMYFLISLDLDANGL